MSKMFLTEADLQAQVVIVEELHCVKKAHVKRLERECAAEAENR